MTEGKRFVIKLTGLIFLSYLIAGELVGYLVGWSMLESLYIVLFLICCFCVLAGFFHRTVYKD